MFGNNVKSRAAIFRVENFHAAGAQDAFKREDIPHIVVDHENFKSREIDAWGKWQPRGLHFTRTDIHADIRSHVLLREMQTEDTAVIGLALHIDDSTEQTGNLPANRKAKARSAVFAAGGSIGLLECFENKFLFLKGNPNSRVSHREDNHAALNSGLRL